MISIPMDIFYAFIVSILLALGWNVGFYLLNKVRVDRTEYISILDSSKHIHVKTTGQSKEWEEKRKRHNT